MEINKTKKIKIKFETGDGGWWILPACTFTWSRFPYGIKSYNLSFAWLYGMVLITFLKGDETIKED